MANNEYINKVEYGDQTLMDITDTTAESGDVIEGQVFYAKSGARSVGTLGDATTSAHGLMSAADKTKLDQFQDASNYITEHQDISGKANSADLATVATTGDYDDLLDKPAIPTKVSELTNDQGYLRVAKQSASYTGETAYVVGSATLAAAVHSLVTFTRVPTAHAIPKYDANAYLYSTTPSSSDNSTKVATTAYVDAAIPNISGFYTKPSGGIPSTDLANIYIEEPSSDGTSGQVLTTNGSGGRSWTTISTYTLPPATDSTLGGVKIGSNITVANDGTISVAATPSIMTGATSSADGAAGLIPAPTSADREKFFRGDGTWQDGGRPMVILSYGNSTWNDFIDAYNHNVIVYCRASSNSNPKTGTQGRMAFMAYIGFDNSGNPKDVEFQYYRSVSSHSATQMGDQVFIYKLTNAGAWSVTTREASPKEIKAGTNQKIGVSWSGNVVTLSNTMTADDMPISSSDATTVKSILEKSFQRGGISAPTTVNDNTLIGTYFARDTVCTGLPTSNTGDYYSIVALGMYQIAARYSSSGAKETYARYYINDQWYGWKSYTNAGGWLASGTNIDTIIIAGTYGIDGTASYTGLPSGVTWGILEVLTPTIGGTYGIQVIHQGRMTYERYRSNSNGTEWGSWYSFTGTIMS